MSFQPANGDVRFFVSTLVSLLDVMFCVIKLSCFKNKERDWHFCCTWKIIKFNTSGLRRTHTIPASIHGKNKASCLRVEEAI